MRTVTTVRLLRKKGQNMPNYIFLIAVLSFSFTGFASGQETDEIQVIFLEAKERMAALDKIIGIQKNILELAASDQAAAKILRLDIEYCLEVIPTNYCDILKETFQ